MVRFLAFDLSLLLSIKKFFFWTCVPITLILNAQS